MKILCICDHAILDQTDDLPYKAYVIPDKLMEEFLEKPIKAYDSFKEAVRNGERKKWIDNYFGPQYPQDLPDDSIADEILGSLYANAMKTMYQCEKCGRIFIQKGESHRFTIFKPEFDNEDWRNILSDIPANNK